MLCKVLNSGLTVCIFEKYQFFYVFFFVSSINAIIIHLLIQVLPPHKTVTPFPSNRNHPGTVTQAHGTLKIGYVKDWEENYSWNHNKTWHWVFFKASRPILPSREIFDNDKLLLLSNVAPTLCSWIMVQDHYTQFGQSRVILCPITSWSQLG